MSARRARGDGLGPDRSDSFLIGVLALQGGFEVHARALEQLGARTRIVRVPADLEGLDGLVIPGGESTTMTLGTCAGLIMLDRDHLGLLDVSVRRNAFGRQIGSFEADLDFEGGPLHAVFIRAPWVEEHGDEVEVLAEVDGHPVAVRQDNVLAVAFHPELTDERRLHRWLLDHAGVTA